MARKRTKKSEDVELLGLLGVGLDNQDGHKRVTRGDEFLLLGGSEETHERMQDAAIRVTEKLKDKGKTLREASVEEVIDLLRDARER